MTRSKYLFSRRVISPTSYIIIPSSPSPSTLTSALRTLSDNHPLECAFTLLPLTLLQELENLAEENG